MAIPDFQTMMLPVLLTCQTGEPVKTSQLYSTVADHFHLTEEERSELLPSGRQQRFKNRVAWALAHLNRAGLLERVGTGTYKLTSVGQEVLASSPAKIDMHLLDQFPGHLEFRRPRTLGPEEGEVEGDGSTQTPSEILEKAYQTLRKSLAAELLDKVRQGSPGFFERLVVELLLRMGYGGSRQDAGSAIGKIPTW